MASFILSVTIFDFLCLFAIIIIEKQTAADRRSARKKSLNHLTITVTVLAGLWRLSAFTRKIFSEGITDGKDSHRIADYG